MQDAHRPAVVLAFGDAGSGQRGGAGDGETDDQATHESTPFFFDWLHQDVRAPAAWLPVHCQRPRAEIGLSVAVPAAALYLENGRTIRRWRDRLCSPSRPQPDTEEIRNNVRIGHGAIPEKGRR